ncbi:maleylpyruvate isomerase family mycothiol-dependent enzyme [Nocardioides marmoriginsengisoli]|uniref:Maleylpyruvate isomerase family mycothiol-dependent enzyme n=1 Tax=Nocardioides marmoriginsengisoli TaxID=661483 RepID=A0A3N0C921_9ACTN|nr:maleylpyruvate isomerase family mycothiol-dependent enzyme [Nocardioides marmoriginsengisoli]RNL59950.1 maleylpyruvate isomerase family mycothiol-dependent enzyme [Nocardioides marmoriginsengisoli]
MPDELEALHRSDQRVVRTVDSLTDAEWAGASLLPGWTRAHVVAHLALNAEGFAGALEALAEGEPRPIYPSEEARDAGIEELAVQDHGVIRERFFAATQHFRNVAEELPDEIWEGTVLRVPEGPEWPARFLVGARRREVEIHHADLGLAYTRQDWPSDFCEALLDHAIKDRAFAVLATDLGRTWGSGTPTTQGTAADLGWWLTGRGRGEGLTGDLPDLG